MRGILFRGKRVEDSTWVTGYYCNCCYPGGDRHRTAHYILEYPDKYHEIYTDTIGQYTGLEDKNGTRIFEGDIFLHNDGHHAIYGIIKFGEFRPSDSSQKFTGFYIEWQNNGANRWGDWLRCDLCFWINERMCELIGNIHDNPRLKEVM